MSVLVRVKEVAGSWSYTVIPDGQVVGAYGWADSEAEAWGRVVEMTGQTGLACSHEGTRCAAIGCPNPGRGEA
jgi:hypothetical protein